MLRLSDFSVGTYGVIIGYDVDKKHRTCLLAMGLTRGTEFQITRVAPLGDPIEIKIRGFSLVLRKNEASIIFVKSTT
jgi:ferrous iron transport protein A